MVTFFLLCSLPAPVLILASVSGSFPGVTAAEGKTWAAQRKWMSTTLKDLGMSGKGASFLEEVITDEAEAFCDRLAEEAQAGPVPIKSRFNAPINNVVMRITTGSVYKYVWK